LKGRYLKRGSDNELLRGSSKPRDCAIARKIEVPHGSGMKTKNIVSLLIATLALAMQPARAQSAASNQDAPSAGYSSSVSTSTVRAVQLALQKAGYYVGKTDGEFTGDTRAAVNEFERDNALPETGTITPEVLKALGLS
jgi:peptidoglycan hydrolase-like protein with peptidoglycan-binding domain